jgi:secreted PhoX family phosphatase
MKSGLAAGTLLALPRGALLAATESAATAAAATLGFRPIHGSSDDAVRLADGYSAQVLLRWGDSLAPGTSALETGNLRRGALLEADAVMSQSRQVGYNCDALCFFPLEASGRRGLLAINHEYPSDELMYPGRLGLGRESAVVLARWCRRYPQAARYSLAALGASIVEIRLDDDGLWRPVADLRLTRRVTGTTPIEITGPARGHALLRTRGDPTGTRVLGTIANCAGGKTPWGTYLTAEENIDDYFGGFDTWRDGGRADPRLLDAHRRLPLREHSIHGWEYTEPRFELQAEPAEALRFGWIVEIDPADPGAPIRKRTALGRFCHEAATCAIAADGRVAVYSGDDEKFEYLYKFLTRDVHDPAHPAASRDLLDAGVLHVARFDADGTGEWLPLVHGDGPLTARSGFADQGEVVIKTRAAADLLGATPLDRPEDIEVHPATGRVYVALTKNENRGADPPRVIASGRPVETSVDVVNPRPVNSFGHILEITEEDQDAAAIRFRWGVFLLAGDPRSPGGRLLTDAAELRAGGLRHADTYFAGYGDARELAPIGCPDNLGFDPAGNLWIVTDGDQPRGGNNGAYAVPVEGPERGHLRQFMSAPRGAEVCGCEFTPNGETLFLSVQHPGEGSTLEQPSSDWPDGGGRPPRPSVIAVRRDGGGQVGS